MSLLITGIFYPIIALSLIIVPALLLLIIQTFLVKRFARAGRIKWLYPLAVLGVSCHELSHFIAAKLFRQRVYEIQFFKPDPSGSLGYVIHGAERPSIFTPIANFVIGMAPLFGGMSAIYAFTYWLMPEVLSQSRGISFSTDNFVSSVFEYAYRSIETAHLAAGEVRLYIWLYIVMSVSLFMMPSKSDFNNSIRGAFYILVVSVCLSWLWPNDYQSWLAQTAHLSQGLFSPILLACIVVGCAIPPALLITRRPSI